MADNVAILALTAIFHFVLVAAIVIPFGWGAMSPLIEAAIIIFSVSVSILTVRLGSAHE